MIKLFLWCTEEAERETKKKRKRMKKLVSRVHINEEGEMGKNF